jgi:hypothetical protein
MTQQDDITQRVLTDDEIRDIITGTHQAFGEFKSGYMLVLGRAIESALLSKLRAPVADERQAVAYLDLGTGGYMDMDTDLTDAELAALPKGRHMLAIIGTHGVNGYTPVSAPMADERAVETFAERFALALKPVAYTTKRGAVYLGKSTQVGSENLCTISQAVYEFRAALASAPVAVEQHDGLRTLLAELPGMHEDPKKGDAVFRCGVNGALNVVERRIRELLRSAPVAGEAQERIEQMAVNRYRPVPDGKFSYKVVAGDGSRSLYTGTKDSCLRVAAKLTEAFLDGAFVASGAAPQASAEDVRNAALEEAAQTAYKALFPTNDRSDWTEFAESAAYHAEWAAKCIHALKTQANKDGGDCAKDAGDVPVHLLDRLRHHAADKANTAFSRSTMAEAAAILDDRQQRAGDDFDVEAAAKTMAECMDYPWAHMPEKGREQMRLHAQSVIRAALSAPQAEQGERDAG